jgi:hypothetical protein
MEFRRYFCAGVPIDGNGANSWLTLARRRLNSRYRRHDLGLRTFSADQRSQLMRFSWCRSRAGRSPMPDLPPRRGTVAMTQRSLKPNSRATSCKPRSHWCLAWRSPRS